MIFQSKEIWRSFLEQVIKDIYNEIENDIDNKYRYIVPDHMMCDLCTSELDYNFRKRRCN